MGRVVPSNPLQLRDDELAAGIGFGQRQTSSSARSRRMGRMPREPYSWSGPRRGRGWPIRCSRLQALHLAVLHLGVIILAAGRGKRMRSSTPKVLHLLGDKPMLSYPLRASTGLGPENVCVVVATAATGSGTLVRRGRTLPGGGRRGGRRGPRTGVPAREHVARRRRS